MTAIDTNKSSLVPALERAYQILDLITANAQAMTAADIAKNLGLPRSSVYNILQSLLQKGLLFKDAENKFYLGSYLMFWAGKFEEQQGVIKIFQEKINYHPTLLNHTVTLSTLDRQTGEIVFLDCRTPQTPLGFTFRAGVRVPAIFAATGKAMLSTWHMDDIKTMYVDGLPKAITDFGVQDFDSLEVELLKTKQNRISLDNGQLREGMYCIGTYIRNHAGKAIAGIAISFLKSEYEAKHAQVAPALIALAVEIEQRLGLSPDVK